MARLKNACVKWVPGSQLTPSEKEESNKLSCSCVGILHPESFIYSEIQKMNNKGFYTSSVFPLKKYKPTFIYMNLQFSVLFYIH